MKVGLTLYSSFPFFPMDLDSVRQQAKSVTEAIATRHELVYLPPEYFCSRGDDAARMCEEFVRSCDVIVGCPSGHLLPIRQRIGSSVPTVGLLLGVMPRGGWGLHDQIPFMTTNDLIVANCTPDLELTNKFIANASARILPFSYNERVYYPMDPAERSAAREKLGFRAEDKVLVYIGRTTLQKNVHTLLRVFSAVQKVVPDALLVIAGPTVEHGSPEFGVRPLGLANTVRKLIARLGIPEDRVRLHPNLPLESVRALYNVAEAMVNMTLHHDENFGAAQVEAMACGTPVVGTAWGGLQDTIVDGVTGYKVSTSVTPMGIKVNWWEAVNRIVSLLEDPAARERFREPCIRHAVERYSQSRLEEGMLEILDTVAEGRDRPAEPLRLTEFGAEFWSGGAGQPYHPGERSYELYRELMGPVAALSAQQVPVGRELDPRQVLCLASPVTGDGDGRFGIDDPMYPFDLEVPQAFREAFEAILAAMREEPATTVERLSRAVAAHAAAAETLAWMLDAGLLLRTAPVDGWIGPERIGRGMSEPVFQVQRIDPATTDFVVY